MRLVEERKSMVIGILLSVALLLGVSQVYLSSKQAKNYQSQANQSLQLIEAYSRVNTLSLEYIEMMGYEEYFSRIPGFWQSLIKDNLAIAEKLSKEELQAWGDKRTEEYFKHKLRPLVKHQREWQDRVNTLFNSQRDFLSNNRPWAFLANSMGVAEALCVMVAMVLYVSLLRSITKRVRT